MNNYFYFVNDQRQLFISNISLPGIKDLLLGSGLNNSATV